METNSVIAKIIFDYRSMLLQQVTLHMKRQRDRISRMRQRFISKLSHRLHRNYDLYRRKRRQLLLDVASRISIRKRAQPKEYNRDWWHAFINREESEFNDEELEQLRMDYGMFNFILCQIKDELANKLFKGVPIAAEIKFSIAIYFLGSGKDYRSVGNKFGVHFSTVHKCLRAFCRAVIRAFRGDVIRMPMNIKDIENATEEFAELAGIPQVIGAIDCLHIAVNQPGNEPTHYVNSKGWTSVIMQAVVDCNGRFLDVSCKHTGHTKDAAVLLESSLYQSMEQLEQPSCNIDGVDVIPCLLGDHGYPLLPWLITPYPPGNEALTDPQRSFNVYIAKARSGISKAFERLVGRWKVLNRGLNLDINFVSEVIITCCILHNIAERLGSPYLDRWSECHNEYDIAPDQPRWECQIVSNEGEVVRNQLCKYMFEHFPLIVDDDD
ncbi:uncharacterized protein LOC128726673 [Anopheles nili]|uniref:uncharacterized protein LOC128726673 n=1 Tax=Anopheles nili TaxID=185578 RepID=UPI00237B70BC|nr:uncharacterized protein LOC128726673 [Anopheles nili]